MISSIGHFMHVLSIFMDFASFIVIIFSFWLLHHIQIYNTVFPFYSPKCGFTENIKLNQKRR